MITVAKIPLLLHVSVASQALPVVAYAFARRRSFASGAVVVGALVSVLSNVVGRILAATAGNNQVVTYLSTPLTGVFFLLAMREFQLTTRERQALRLGIAVFLALWVLLVAFVEDMRGFNLASGPLFSLMLLALGAWTLVRRALIAEIAPLYQQDWFWISAGMATYGACTALAEPIGGILLARQRFDLFNIAWQVRAALSTLGFAMMSWGIYLGPMVSKFSTLGQSETEIV